MFVREGGTLLGRRSDLLRRRSHLLRDVPPQSVEIDSVSEDAIRIEYEVPEQKRG